MRHPGPLCQREMEAWKGVSRSRGEGGGAVDLNVAIFRVERPVKAPMWEKSVLFAIPVA